MPKRLLPLLACLVGYAGGLGSLSAALPKEFGNHDLAWIGLYGVLLALMALAAFFRPSPETRPNLVGSAFLTSLAFAFTASGVAHLAVGIKRSYFSELAVVPDLAFAFAWMTTLPLVVGLPKLRRTLPEKRVALLSHSLGRMDTGHLAILLVPVLLWGVSFGRNASLGASHGATKRATFLSLDDARRTLTGEVGAFTELHQKAEKRFRSVPETDPTSGLVECASASDAVLGCALVETSGKSLIASRVTAAQCGLCALGECSREGAVGEIEIRKTKIAEHLLPDLSTTVARALPAAALGGAGCEETPRLVPLGDARGFLLVSLSLRTLSKNFDAVVTKAKLTRGRAFITDSSGTVVASSNGSHLVNGSGLASPCRTVAECGLTAGNIRLSALGYLAKGKPHSSMTLFPSKIWLISSADLGTPGRPSWLLTVHSELEVPP